ncbi:MAG: redoxin domain-containing protein [Cyanobacteria bacterium CRU_2_1]|nr:redoxin domain-containing protein [Cyanobacteria bacterium RU_5_0]NJR57705.1 redoxin domain-containing protein [Cyanobacteria bacterium CRU_2_1]
MARIRAPELPSHYPWLNTDRPLSLKDLKGRIVLLDFWTYCCINCLHILPDLKYLEQKYKDCLTVIGVHSAKFDNEQETENIRQAILRYDIEHPVLVDRSFRVWEEYTVRAWPTLMVIDPDGYVIGSVAGEGKREMLDQLIAKIIQEHREKGSVSSQELSISLEKQRKPLASRLAFPGKVFADEASHQLFIADSGYHRIVVSTLSGEIRHIIGTGTAGLKDGCFAEAQFFAPQGMAFDRPNHTLYVADTENHTIRRVNLERQTVETIAGTGTQSHQIRPHCGNALETALNSPWDLVKIGESLFIAMAGSHQIWTMSLQDNTIGTYAGTGAEACVDGHKDEATFAQPSGITTNGKELFIADSEGSTIRAIDLKTSQVRTVCGSGDLFGFGDVDGQGEQVLLQHCLGVEFANTTLWIADTYNHKIKLVDPQTRDCQSILGDGRAGLIDDRGMNTRFYEPSGLSIAGNFLYIADTNNHVIRRANLETLTITTLSFPELCAPDVCVPSQITNS